MMQPSKMMEIAEEINKFNYDLMTLQEIRWAGTGMIKKKDFTLYYSGGEKMTGLYGTDFIINAKTRKNVICFEPMGERMSKITLRGQFRNITIISILAPTEDKP